LLFLIQEGATVIKKVIVKTTLGTPALEKKDLEYWLERDPAERIEAVEFLRRQLYGSSIRLQRTARVVEQI
jgi:hypothetical protein